MKINTRELTGAALDWAVATAEYKDGRAVVPLFGHSVGVETEPGSGIQFKFWPSTDWSQGGPIIEREGITVVRLDDRSIPDAKGFWQGKYEPQWAATDGSHSIQEVYGSQGDHFGNCYQVDEDAVTGPTPLIAAMRCFVASRLGNEVDVPDELSKET